MFIKIFVLNKNNAMRLRELHSHEICFLVQKSAVFPGEQAFQR